MLCRGDPILFHTCYTPAGTWVGMFVGRPWDLGDFNESCSQWRAWFCSFTAEPLAYSDGSLISALTAELAVRGALSVSSQRQPLPAPTHECSLKCRERHIGVPLAQGPGVGVWEAPGRHGVGADL